MLNTKAFLAVVTIAAGVSFAQARQAPPPGAPAAKAPATTLSRDSKAALDHLYARSSAAKALGQQATAVLVFPSIKKTGFVVGGEYGEGTLFRAGKPTADYSTAGLSYGLQAGAQTFDYAMFFMNDKALAQLDKADGFEVGVGPSMVVVDEGMAKSITSTTMKDDTTRSFSARKG